MCPLSINSLAYGTDTDGLLFTDEDPEAERMAATIANLLNLKEHFIEEKGPTKKIKRACLPYTVQLHRNKEMQDDRKFYLVNAFRLFP